MRDTSPRLRATPAARSQASSILSAAATGLVSFILLEGGDPDRVLGLAGVSATALGQPASSLGLDLYCRVMEQAAADTCNGNFGLRYGQQYEPGQLGLLGYVALASPTVGAAFENISGLFHHHQQRSILRVVRQPELSRIEYQILDRSIAARRQDAELSLGMFFNILRHALGSRWSPEAVLFEHARPESWPEHERSFGAPALFAQPCNAIVLPTRQLDAPMPGADAHLLALLRHNLAQLGLAGMPGESLVERAAAAIRRQLADGEPSLDDVARALNIPNWTLQRRLRNHGCTYQELLLEVRRELALNYLKDREIQISELAFLLGYSEISAFPRLSPLAGHVAQRVAARLPGGGRRGIAVAGIRRRPGRAGPGRRAQSRFHKTIQGKHHGSRAQHGRRGFVAPIAEVAADHGRRLLPRRYRGRPQARHPRQAGRTGAGRGQPDALRLRPAARAADPGPYRQRWRRQLRAGLS